MEHRLSEMGQAFAVAQNNFDLDQVDENRGRERLLETLIPSRQMKFPYYLAAAAVLACVAWVLVWLHGPAVAFCVGSDRRIGHTGEWIAAPREAMVSLHFDDGTELRLLPNGRARVTDIDARGATVVVEHGELQANVRHRITSRWRIDVGPFRVSVVGTAFDVSWEPNAERFFIRLREGKVTVAGPVVGVERTVSTGEQLEVWVGRRESKWAEIHDIAPPTIETMHAPPSTPLVGSVSTADIEIQRPIASAGFANEKIVDPLAQFRQLASGNRYTDALAEAERIGFASLCSGASSTDVLLLGDVARLAGNWQRAQQAYRSARLRFTGDASARATFMLARTAFDQGGNYAESAEHFAAYLKEAPHGRLAREAASRLIEARMRAGDHAGAKAASVEYLERYPTGPYAGKAKEIIFSP